MTKQRGHGVKPVAPFFPLDTLIAYQLPSLLAMPILLRQWREKRGYSVRELAERAGVSYVTVVRIENDQISPTVALLEKLAKALGIGMRDFFPVERQGRRPRR